METIGGNLFSSSPDRGGLCHGAKTLGDCFVVGIRLSLGFFYWIVPFHSVLSCTTNPPRASPSSCRTVHQLYIYLITTSSLTECPSRVESS